MRVLHWIRFDIPYGDDSTIMRTAAGIKEDNTLSVKLFEDQKDIPSSVDLILDYAQNERIEISSALTLVIPHDERHGLAWVVKELSEKKSYQFARHVPAEYDPGIEDELPFAGPQTGGSDDGLAVDQATGRIKGLNLEAHTHFQQGYMLEAMTLLRRALYLAVRYTGWTSEISCYTLRNLVFSLTGTGNPDNERHAVSLIRRFLKQAEGSGFTVAANNTAVVEYINGIAQAAERCRAESIAQAVLRLIQ